MSKEILLTRGYTAIIDDEDFESVSRYKWCAMPHCHTTYAIRFNSAPGLKPSGTGNQKVISLHRFIMNAKPGQIIDHKDGNGLNCTKANMRFCTAAQNVYNTVARGKTSKYKGVCFISKARKWRAQVGKDNVSYIIGDFDTELEAAQAYDGTAPSFHGEFVRINGVEGARYIEPKRFARRARHSSNVRLDIT